MALTMYQQDYHEFPSPENWSNRLSEYGEYYEGETTLRCQEATDPKRPAYAYNSALSGLKSTAVGDTSQLVAFFESDVGRDAAGGPELLPERSRHYGGDNVGFVDGHVRSYKRPHPLWRGEEWSAKTWYRQLSPEVLWTPEQIRQEPKEGSE